MGVLRYFSRIGRCSRTRDSPPDSSGSKPIEVTEESQILRPFSDHDKASRYVGTRTAPRLCSDCMKFLQVNNEYTDRYRKLGADIRYTAQGSQKSYLKRDCYLCLSISKAWKLWDNRPLPILSVRRYDDLLTLRPTSNNGQPVGDLELYSTPVGNVATFPAGSTDIWQALKVSRPDMSLSPFPERSLHFMKTCLRQCLDTHGPCRSQRASGSAAYPSRLVSVGTVHHDHCKLVESDGVTQWDYAALSYCWGNSQFIQSNRETFAQYRRAIPISTFPNAFREAIFICRELSIFYLWIDSLCILQDDLSDWAVESAKMADVYEGALLVIAASAAENPHQSFFSPQDSATCEELEIEPKDLKRNALTIKARKCLENSGWHKGTGSQVTVPLDPLETRGWALQERLLATRYVSCTEKEVQWHCRSYEHCECGSRTTSRAKATFHSRLMSSPSLAWESAVYNFTERVLSREEDRLPALTGIATRVSQLTGSTYFCGLWRESLVDNLCWTVWPHGETTFSPSTYQAPTFSWASVCGNITYGSHDSLEATPIPYITIVEAKSTAKTANPFGEVSDAFMVVDGWLLDAKLGGRGMDNHLVRIIPSTVTTRCCLDLLEWEIYLDTTLDATTTRVTQGRRVDARRSTGRSLKPEVGADPIEGVPVKCLKIRSRIGELSTPYLDILVLARSQTVVGAYERIGLLSTPWQSRNEEQAGHEELHEKVEAWLDTSNVEKTRMKLV